MCLILRSKTTVFYNNYAFLLVRTKKVVSIKSKPFFKIWAFSNSFWKKFSLWNFLLLSEIVTFFHNYKFFVNFRTIASKHQKCITVGCSFWGAKLLSVIIVSFYWFGQEKSFPSNQFFKIFPFSNSFWTKLLGILTFLLRL